MKKSELQRILDEIPGDPEITVADRHGIGVAPIGFIGRVRTTKRTGYHTSNPQAQGNQLTISSQLPSDACVLETFFGE